MATTIFNRICVQKKVITLGNLTNLGLNLYNSHMRMTFYFNILKLKVKTAAMYLFNGNDILLHENFLRKHFYYLVISSIYELISDFIDINRARRGYKNMFLKIEKTCDNICARLSDDVWVFNYNL